MTISRAIDTPCNTEENLSVFFDKLFQRRFTSRGLLKGILKCIHHSFRSVLPEYRAYLLAIHHRQLALQRFRSWQAFRVRLPSLPQLTFGCPLILETTNRGNSFREPNKGISSDLSFAMPTCAMPMMLLATISRRVMNGKGGEDGIRQLWTQSQAIRRAEHVILFW